MGDSLEELAKGDANKRVRACGDQLDGPPAGEAPALNLHTSQWGDCGGLCELIEAKTSGESFARAGE